MAIAERYWAIERMGTKSQLAKEAGITRVKLYEIAREFETTFGPHKKKTPGSEQRGGLEASA